MGLEETVPGFLVSLTNMYVCLYRLVSAFRVLGEHVLKPLSGLVLRRALISEDMKHLNHASQNILFSSVRSDLK